MKRLSISAARTRLSALVVLAEERQKVTILLRHGKPKAAIVPLALLTELKRKKPKKSRRTLTPDKLKELFRALTKREGAS